MLSRSDDSMSLSGGHNEVALVSDSGYSWVFPGLAIKFAEAIHGTDSFTASQVLTYTPSINDLSSKQYDGGVHSYIKLNTVAIGTGNTFYSKLIPAEYLQNRNCLLVFNSLANKHTYGAGDTKALTCNLESSIDGVNFNTLAVIIDDNDITDTVAYSNTFQYSHLLAGINYGKFNYYRFSWYIEAGAHTERIPLHQNFLTLSLYPIGR